MTESLLSSKRCSASLTLQRLLVWTGRLLLGLALVLGVLFLLLRDVALPRINSYRQQITQHLEEASGLPVSIGSLAVEWGGLRPQLQLFEVAVRDERGRVVLRLPRVSAAMAWSSLLRWQVHFHRLEIIAPELSVRRSRDGRLSLAGISVGGGDSNALSDWLMQQGNIVIRDAVLTWLDQTTDAPELRLEKVNFQLIAPAITVLVRPYRFGFSAQPPAGMGEKLEFRGELRPPATASAAAAPISAATPWGRLPAFPGISASVYMALENAKLAAWQPWIDALQPIQGNGSVQLWSRIDQGEIVLLQANLALRDFSMQFDHDLAPLQLSTASGAASLQRTSTGLGEQLALKLHALRLADEAPLNADLVLTLEDGEIATGRLQAPVLELAALTKLAASLPLPQSWHQALNIMAPQGRFEALRFSWQAKQSAWSGRGKFSGVSSRAWETLPGIKGINGEFDGDWQVGTYRLEGEDLALDLPKVFSNSLLHLDSLQAKGGWSRLGEQLQWHIDEAQFENKDAAGSAHGRYVVTPEGKGEVDLEARLVRAQAQRVWQYIPLIVDESVRNWLRQGLKAGEAENVHLQLRGALDAFPYRDGDGQFLITIPVKDARLHYADGWPEIDNIEALLSFEKEGMSLEVAQAQTLGIPLRDVHIQIAELEEPLLQIRGQVQSASQHFLRFIGRSPVSHYIHGLTNAMVAHGQGKLALELDIPLQELEHTAVRGNVQFANNRIKVLAALPAVNKASGRIEFSENGVLIPHIEGEFLARPLKLSAASDSTGTLFEFGGEFNVDAAVKQLDWPILSVFAGETSWQGKIRLEKDQSTLQLSSNLAGLASMLPAPARKKAEEHWPLTVEIQFEPGQRRQLMASLEDRAKLVLTAQETAAGWKMTAGGLGVGVPARTVASGLQVNARVDHLDLDAWRLALAESAVEAGDARQAKAVSQATHTGVGGLLHNIRSVHLQAGELIAFGEQLHELEFNALTNKESWLGQISSDRAEGSFEWLLAGQGKLAAHFSRLVLGGKEEQDDILDVVPEVLNQNPSHLPALSVIADSLQLNGIGLGKLWLEARNVEGNWLLDQYRLTGNSSVMQGSGSWQPGVEGRTKLDLDFETSNIGHFLSGIGYPEVIDNGQARLNGSIDWRGPPTGLDLPTLNGALELEASNGQFRQLEAGMGRLLGILSLQSLPRRLKLDFRDVFSQGYAFDQISGRIHLEDGALNTDRLRIAGPAARIVISGSADVVHETQTLQVYVQPTLSESVAIGAATGLINPVAGVVTYLAQKALQDPIEKMFSYRYGITGSWLEPDVKKLTAPLELHAENAGTNQDGK